MMNFSDSLMGMIGWGVDAVLILLVLLSIGCLAYSIDRLVYFYHNRTNISQMMHLIQQALEHNNGADLETYARETKKLEAKVIAEAFQFVHLGPNYVREFIDAKVTFNKGIIEKGMNFLGTVGSNAPFIGLFGTVLGIIKAFHDLAANSAGGIVVVMSGIADALIATAVGLIVAIPAVMAYNFFQAKVNQTLENVDKLGAMMAVELETWESKKWEQRQEIQKAQ